MKKGKENPIKPERDLNMKTVEIVKMPKGYYVTRHYCGRNNGMRFFPTVAPETMKKREQKKFLQENAEAKEKYIKEWVGE